MQKTKLIIIVGPNASGKSELAVRIAKKNNGEIVSADSKQIYRNLDIGTGKVPGKWRKGKFIYKKIPHYCIDFVSPISGYSVAEYKKKAEESIKDIASRGKIPILVGGTGFWIDTVVYDLNLPEVAPNPRLRKNLDKKSPEKLLKILQKLDPERAKTIEQKNPRRLVRAIEIASSIGAVPRLKKYYRYTTLWIGLRPPKNILKKKIANRVRKMIKKGICEETKKIIKQGVSKKRIGEFGFEYRAILNQFNKRVPRLDLEKRIIKDSLKYARRQIVWFKRNKKIHWTKNPQEAINLAKNFISQTLRPT